MVRAIGGLLSIVVLLGLLTADFWYADRALNPTTTATMLALISALLGIDILREKLPLKLSVQQPEEAEKEE